MILDGQVLGRPLISYKDTKTSIESLTGLVEGMSAYATDADQIGYYTGSIWVWLSNTSGSYIPIVHDITGAYHSTSGRTANQVLQATGATTLGWSSNTLSIAGNSTINGSLIGNISGGGSISTTVGQTYTLPSVSGDVSLGAGTLTYATTNNVAIASHTHAITSSSNVGVAPFEAILKSDSSAGLTLGGYLAIGFGNAAVTGQFRMANNAAMNWRNSANTGDIQGFLYDSSGIFRVANGGLYVFGAGGTTTMYIGNNNGKVSIGNGVNFPTEAKLYVLHDSSATPTIWGLLNNATTTAIDEVVRYGHNSTGTPGVGFGSRSVFTLKSSTTSDQTSGAIDVVWNVATHASAVSDMVFSAAYNSGAAIVASEFLRGRGNAGIIVTGSQTGTYTTTAVDLTLTAAHHLVRVTAAKTITLPTAVGISGREYIITATANNVIVDASTTELINGSLTQVLMAGDSMQIKSDGAGWRII